jgi:hypothetical protein
MTGCVHGRRGVGRTGLLMLALAASLAGCSSYSGGHSGTCRYGLRTGQGGNHCYSRPKPSDELVAQAMSAETLARALGAWRRTRGASVVLSVGINRWAETTFTVPTGDTGFGAKRGRLVTFDVHGRSTSGNEEYVSEPRDPFRVSAVRPEVVARVLRRIRASQPDTVLLKAVFAVGPFSAGLVWRVAVISSHAGSALVYETAPDGSGLCHGRDVVNDALVPARGIPTCNRPVLSF